MSLETQSPALEQVRLRRFGEADLEFLRELYASTRAQEMAMTGWSRAEQDNFLRMQFDAQHKFYSEQFPDAAFDVIEKDGASIGRLYLDRRLDEIRIIDIALMPNNRGAGIGGALMQAILDEAGAVDKAVRIHVERNNPAMRLYNRLGFRQIEDQGVYWLMEWKQTV